MFVVKFVMMGCQNRINGTESFKSAMKTDIKDIVRFLELKENE